MTPEKSENVPRMMTINEVAKTGILRRNTIAAGCRTGWIPHIKVGTKYYINYDKLVQILQEC